MQRLRNALGHTVALAKITGARASMVDACEGGGLVSISVRTGLDMPLHANAGGKLVFAFGEPEVQRAIDTTPLEKFTEHTITDTETLKAEVERVRQQGWANAPEEFVIGINAIAAPIFDRENRLIATMALVNSIQFLGRRPTVEQIGAITAAAAEITRHLALTR